MALKKSGGPIVGLDIGTSFIKVCEVDCRGGRANLRGVAVIPTPPEAVVNDEIVDPVAVGRALKQALKQARIKASGAVSSVASQNSLVVRIIEVPKMTAAELKETMKWEMERHVPFASEPVVMDYQPLTPPDQVPEGQNMEVLMVVVQEGLVMRHLEVLQAAGLKPIAIDIEPLAHSRALLYLSNGGGPQGTVAIADLGADTTDISIYRNGNLCFTRSIQIAGSNLTRAIADVLGRPLPEAEQLKKDMAAIPEQPQAVSAGPGFGASPFGDLGFGFETEPEPLGGATQTDTHAEPTVDIAGAGFSAEAFTGGPAGGIGGSIFDTPAEEPAPGPSLSELAGPTPMANPFSFDEPPPGSPFGAPSDNPFAAAGGTAAGGSTIPESMSEEDYLRTHIADAIIPVLHELVTELRRSLDFYRNRAGGLGAEKLILTGGTARLPGLADFLSANLDIPVEVGDPMAHLNVGSSDPAYLREVGSVFPVSVGLALRELLVEPSAPRAASRPERARKTKK